MNEVEVILCLFVDFLEFLIGQSTELLFLDADSPAVNEHPVVEEFKVL